jgi:hypothetical protein
MAHPAYLPLVMIGYTAPTLRQAYMVALESSGPYEAYDITDPLRPVRLTGFRTSGNVVTVADPAPGQIRRYLVVATSTVEPARLRDPAALDEPPGADYLIIAPDSLIPPLAPLIALRESQSLSTTVIDLQAIYETYGDGRPNPEAIRAFVAHAYATWSPRPTYVLLVGDGSYDPLQYWPTSSPTLLPPYLLEVDPWAGETATDNRYACVDGDDSLPDLLIGRLPVGSAAETQLVVEKIVGYESDPLPGGWNLNVLLVADDQDTGGDFAASSEAHGAHYVGSPFTATRRYCSGGSDSFSDCPSFEVAALRTDLVGDWHQGGLLFEFTGHASWQQWASERYFHLDDLAALTNVGRLPVVAEMTCFTAAFHRPEPTLDESLVTLADGGAVAAWGPTGLGVGTGHGALSDGFFGSIFVTGSNVLGQATLAGKVALATTGQHLYLLDTFVLLGDPALRLQNTIIAWPHATYLPLVIQAQAP